MSTEDAKAYLASKSIPQLFESLMTGLMYSRPEDHIEYLKTCLQQLDQDEGETVPWNRFIPASKPLPAISPTGRSSQRTTPRSQTGSSVSMKTPDVQPRPSPAPLPAIQTSSNVPPQTRNAKVILTLEERIGTPLPAIHKSADDESSLKSIQLPNGPIVLLLGGPGSGRSGLCKRLVDRYIGWAHVGVGDLLRQEVNTSSDNKWRSVASAVDEGNLAPENDVLEILKKNIEVNRFARGLIVDGFPRTMQQMEAFEKYVGRVDAAFVVDCSLSRLRQRLLQRSSQDADNDDNTLAIENRLKIFNAETLPVIKYVDDKGLLTIIEGDADEDDIFYQLASHFDNKLVSAEFAKKLPRLSPRPPSVPRGQSRQHLTLVDPASIKTPRSPRPTSGMFSRMDSGFINVPKTIEVEVEDTGRVENASTQCHIIFMTGGPNSGRKALCERIVESRTDVELVSIGALLRDGVALRQLEDIDWDQVSQQMTAGELVADDLIVKLLINALIPSDETSLILVDGFPRTKKQLEHFNQLVGGLTAVILLDCDEQYMKERGQEAGHNADVLIKKISLYKHNVLPVLGYLDDVGKLDIVLVNEDMSKDDIKNTVDNIIESRMKTAISKNVTEVNIKDEVVTEPLPPPCTVISIIGYPGVDVEELCRRLVQKYPLTIALPESRMAAMQTIATNLGASAVFLPGYPVNELQLDSFNSQVGRLDCVISVDFDATADESSEEISSYLNSFVNVADHFEKLAVLKHVNRNASEDDLFNDICRVVDELIGSVSTDQLPTLWSLRSTVSKLDVEAEDNGRQDNLPTGHIVSIYGLTGSGIDIYSEKLVSHFNAVYIHAKGLSVDELTSHLRENMSAPLFILENYPSNSSELNDFNRQIGGLTAAVAVDMSEDFALGSGAASEEIEEFKLGTLPVHVYLDECRKLTVLNGEKEELYNELHNAIETVQQPTAAVDAEFTSEHAVDEVVVQNEVQATGDRGNIFYLRELEESDVSKAVDDEAEAFIDMSHTVELEDTEVAQVDEETMRRIEAEIEGLIIPETYQLNETELETTQPSGSGNADVPEQVVEVVDETVIADNPSTEELSSAKIIFVLGGPGSGKGTQCDKIVATYGFTHLSTGDLLRDEVSSGSERGKNLTEIMKRGELVPLDAVLTLLKEAMIKKASASKGFLIDGYPRELEQGKKFEADVAPVSCVLYFEVSDDTMKSRLLKRAETSGRADDNEETIVKRLKTFHDVTTPVVDYYGAQNKVCTIHAEGTVDEIFSHVKAYLDKQVS